MTLTLKGEVYAHKSTGLATLKRKKKSLRQMLRGEGMGSEGKQLTSCARGGDVTGLIAETERAKTKQRDWRYPFAGKGERTLITITPTEGSATPGKKRERVCLPLKRGKENGLYGAGQKESSLKGVEPLSFSRGGKGGRKKGNISLLEGHRKSMGLVDNYAKRRILSYANKGR